MAFQNLKNVMRVGAGPFSCIKLAVAAAVTSRPSFRRWLIWTLRLSADRAGVLWVKATCGFSRRKLLYGLRLSDLPSDILTFYEHCIVNSYRINESRAPDLVLDGGANTGLFTMAILSRWPAVRILAIEPLPDNIEVLRANLKANNFTAEIIPVCLAALEGEAKFYVREANSGGLSDSEEFERVITVKTVPLSDLYAPFRGRNVLIKLDIEGAEMPVIEQFLRQPVTKVNIVGELHNWKDNRNRLTEMFNDAGWNVNYFSEDAACVLFSAKSPD
jgi:FkbM family methyltransferase